MPFGMLALRGARLSRGAARALGEGAGLIDLPWPRWRHAVEAISPGHLCPGASAALAEGQHGYGRAVRPASETNSTVSENIRRC